MSQTTPQTLSTHPVLSIVPMMGEAEFLDLVDDIRANGQLEQITIYEGKILDGRARYQACLSLGLNPSTYEFDGTANEAMIFVLSTNVFRRHLTKAQRAAVALNAQKWQEARERKRKPKGEGDGRSREHVAKAAGVSDGYVAQAAAIKKQSPEVFEKLLAGAVSMAQAKTEAAASTSRPKTSPAPRAVKRDATLPKALSVLNADLLNISDLVSEHGAAQLVGAASEDELRLLGENVQRGLAALGLLEQAMNED